MLQKAGIEKKISPHKLRHTYAANLLNVGVELVEIQALLGHSTLNTTPIDAHVDQNRMEAWLISRRHHRSMPTDLPPGQRR